MSSLHLNEKGVTNGRPFVLLVGTVAVIIVIVGCGSPPPASSGARSPRPIAQTVEPTETQLPTPLPVVATPTLAPRPTPAPLPTEALTDPLVGTVVVTVSDRMRVRSEPRVSDDSFKYEPLLPLGTELTVLDGPVRASGYTWYMVEPVSFAELDGPGYGWVAAAAKDGEPWIWPADQSDTPLSGVGTARIDGALSPGEWSGARRLDFAAFVPPSQSGAVTPASLYVMNDATNLYLAIMYVGSFDTTTVTFEFDNDGDGGATEDGDDVILANLEGSLLGSTSLYDDFRYRCPGETEPGRCGLLDTEAGSDYPPPGTLDGAAAGGRADGETVVEMSHPLASGDQAHDFQVKPGTAIGFVLYLAVWNVCDTNECSAETFLPRTGQRMDQIVVS